ncbi:MAG TPA: hypothetical protein G4N98_06960 [Thermoflexia bacterium]|nr:hypothetical protein [Thermoflexia bacterium]
MATILRKAGPSYQAYYDKVPLALVANSERRFPEAWITPSRTDVTADFVCYARPLIGESWPHVPLVAGLQRFTRFEPLSAPQ